MAVLSPPESAQKPVSTAISVIALAALVALLYYGRDFFVTLIVSAVFAFILDPVVLMVMKLRVPRPAATAIVIGVAVVATYLVGAMAWTQLSTFSENLPGYTSHITELWGKASDRMDQFEKQTIETVVPKSLRDQGQQIQQIQQKPQQALKARKKRSTEPAQPSPSGPPPVQEVRVHADPKPFITTIYSYASGYFHALVMASFVPFLVYFMLSWRDHISKSVLRLFHGENRYRVGKTWSGIGDTTRAYVLGNFLLWVFLSCVSAITFFFFGVPYWPVVGLLSAFFSLVPYVGLPLSMLPPVLAAVSVPNRFKVVLGLIIVVGILHVASMNFLYAKIIGRRVKLNPLVVTIALMFWGLLWGGVGLLLAIPITAALKTLCDNVESLTPYGRLLGD